MYITGLSTVTVSNTNIYDNKAYYVCFAIPRTFLRRPDGRNFRELTD